MQKLFIKDIMTARPVTVGFDDLVVYAAKLLVEGNFNGLPVVDSEGKLVGILTEYDLVSKKEALHLPTLIRIFSNLDFYKKDQGEIKGELKNLLTMKVSEIMNREPLTVNESQTIDELAVLFAEHHKVNPIPVINAIGKLVGIVSRYDLVRFFADKSAAHQNSNGQQSAADAPDKRIDEFVSGLAKEFTLVSKKRTKLWLVVSVLFAVVGFIIAFAIILRLA